MVGVGRRLKDGLEGAPVFYNGEQSCLMGGRNVEEMNAGS